MPTQNKIIKDQQVTQDTWQLLREETELNGISDAQVIVPFEAWQNKSELTRRNNLGVWLNNDINLPEIADKIRELPLIAIDFPGFMDGRGFSLARLLRERYQYQGELRAIGHIIRDQLCYLKRCGFNAFMFDDSVDLHAALDSLNDFTDAYQTAADTPSPLFRRRAG